MNERSAILLGVLAGAVVGGVAGYLFLTESGRRLREDLEPHLRDLANELTRSRGRTAGAAPASDESWAGRA